MERVDVVIVGGGTAGLAAASAAAGAGVRVIVVERGSLPESRHGLTAITAGDLRALGLGANAAEAIHHRFQVDGQPPAELGPELALYVVRAQTLQQHLYSRARSAGAEIRDGATAIGCEPDHEGWVLRVARGEPIRAPIVIVADGARSPTLGAIGVARAQRFSTAQAEVVTFLLATWDLPPSELGKYTSYRVYEDGGAFGRAEILPGRERLTLALGPLWQPDPKAGTARLEVACRKLALPLQPRTIEYAEWRLDALPMPPVFDGGIVIGAAAGHRPRRPLTAQPALFRGGQLAGKVAAEAVHEKAWTAAILGQKLGPAYRALCAEVDAEIAYEAHGLRRGPASAAFTLSAQPRS